MSNDNYLRDRPYKNQPYYYNNRKPYFRNNPPRTHFRQEFGHNSTDPDFYHNDTRREYHDVSQYDPNVTKPFSLSSWPEKLSFGKNPEENNQIQNLICNFFLNNHLVDQNQKSSPMDLNNHLTWSQTSQPESYLSKKTHGGYIETDYEAYPELTNTRDSYYRRDLNEYNYRNNRYFNRPRYFKNQTHISSYSRSDRLKSKFWGENEGSKFNSGPADPHFEKEGVIAQKPKEEDSSEKKINMLLTKMTVDNICKSNKQCDFRFEPNVFTTLFTKNKNPLRLVKGNPMPKITEEMRLLFSSLFNEPTNPPDPLNFSLRKKFSLTEEEISLTTKKNNDSKLKELQICIENRKQQLKKINEESNELRRKINELRLETETLTYKSEISSVAKPVEQPDR